MAKIDVLLPVRNGIKFLGESIDSIRNQTFSDWRILILDHGSSDGSMELAIQCADTDKRIEIYSYPEADGLAGLLNVGLKKCDCKYLMRHDADDVAVPKRMEIMNEVFSTSSKYMVVGGEAMMIDDAGHDLHYLSRPIGERSVTAASFFYCPMVHPTITIDYAAFNKIGAAYGKDFLNILPGTESLSVNRHAEDYMLFGQLALLGLCTNIKAPLIKYRVHSGGVSVANIVEQLKISFAISKYLTKSFCRMKNLREFNPVPFCNHGGHLYNIGKQNLPDAYRNMSESLIQGLGKSPELTRELAFRWVIATGRPLNMLMRYAGFELKHRRNNQERGLILNWFRRTLNKRKYQYLDDF